MRTQTIVLTGLVFGLIAKFQPIEPVVIVGRSMEPTLHDRQFVLANKKFETISRGDIIVFKRNDETLIKRVAYLPGDTFTEYQNGMEWLVPANAAEEENYKESMPLHKVTVVPAGMVFVLGDNSKESLDSRDFGPVDLQSVTAKVTHTEEKSSAVNGVHLTGSTMAKREGAEWVTGA